MKKLKLIITILLIFVNYFINAQDLIILKDGGDTIKCKIIEDKILSLEYRLYNSTDTSLYKIHQSLYENYIIESEKHTEIINQTPNYSKEKLASTKKTFKKGIYLNVEQFLNNSPAFDCEFEVIHRTQFNIAMNGGNDYKIKSLTDTISNKKIRKLFWGISDGTNVYINCRKMSSHRFYSMLNFEEDYAYFSAIPFMYSGYTSSSYMGGAIGGAAAGAAAALARELYKLNLKNGNISLYYKQRN